MSCWRKPIWDWLSARGPARGLSEDQAGDLAEYLSGVLEGDDLVFAVAEIDWAASSFQIGPRARATCAVRSSEVTAWSQKREAAAQRLRALLRPALLLRRR